MVAFVVQSVQFEQPGRTMATIAGTVLAVAYVGLLGSFMIQLRWFDGPYHGILPLVFLVATAKGADTGAYTFGPARRPAQALAPAEPQQDDRRGRRRPGLRASAAALIVAAIARYVLHVPTLTWPAAVGFGLVVGSAAQLGDLMESMIKRDCAQGRLGRRARLRRRARRARLAPLRRPGRLRLLALFGP